MIKCITNVSIILLLFTSNCSHPLKYFYKEIGKYGYINYTTPLRYSGTGTMIGGTPSTMEIIAHPQTCFPSEINGQKTNLRYIDESSLPTTHENFIIDTKLFAEFFDILSKTSPSIRAGIKINQIRNILIQFEGVHVEYIDIIKLVNFYKQHMPGLCKEYLDQVGFIVQAIKTNKLRFSLYDKNDVRIELDADNIKQYLDFSWDIDWTIEKRTELVINTPKYIGYQLGGLRKKSQGFSLLRASKVKRNRWVFKHIGVFEDSKKQQNRQLFISDSDGFQS